jgi:short-subunit dehydrogenase
MQPLDYHGQTILITGASSGLGIEFAHRLAAQGADLVLVARRAERLAAVAEELVRAHDVTVTVIPMDLAEDGVGKRLRRDLERRDIRLTGLINNAGFGDSGALHTQDPELLSRMVRLNVDTVVDLSRTFLEDLRGAGCGILVNVASLAGYQPNPGLAVYGASKAFVLNFTQALWEEERRAGLRVLALCPGPARTEFFDVAGKGAGAGLPEMEAADVVDAALRALGRRNPPPSVTPGLVNKASALGSGRLLPGRFVIPTVGAMMRRAQKD